MQHDEMAELEEMCGQLVGFVRANGRAFATRGWGLKILDGGRQARVLVGATELDHLGTAPGDLAGTSIAVTGADIGTLESRQLKGPVTAVDPADPDDEVCKQRYVERYHRAVEEVDGLGERLMARLVPAEVVACTFLIEERYDQTPGPRAGRPIDSGAG